jgi:hypothetical protein
MKDAWRKIVENQGGASRSDLEIISEEEIPEPGDDPDDDEKEVDLSNGRVGGYTDTLTDGESEFDEDQEDVLAYIKAHAITGNLTDRQILENLERGMFKKPTEPELRKFKQKAQQQSGVRDFDHDLSKVRSRFGKTIQSVVARYVSYNPNNPASKATFSSKCRALAAEAKKLCGVTDDVPNIDDAEVLQELIRAIPKAERIVFDN